MKRTMLFCAAMLLSGAMAIPTMARFAISAVSGDTALGENQPGWMFGRDPANATPIAFNFDAGSLGPGSLYVEPIGNVNAHKFIGEFFMLSPLADVETISYDFMIGTGAVANATAYKQFYLNLYANFGSSPAAKFFDCAYTVVPSAGSSSDFTTVTFDPNDPYPVRTSTSSPNLPTLCPAVPADMGPGATLRMFALNLGDTSGVDIGHDGYFDNVVVTQTTGTTTFDFGPTADTCRNDGWLGLGFANQGQCIQRVNTGR